MFDLIPMIPASDTIAAIATPPGRGGVGIVRVAGPLVKRIATAVLGHVPPPRQAEYHPFRGGHDEVIDHGIALYFAAPHSFTGEDVLELQGHGGPVVMDLLLRRVITLGARLARPGEFSLHAFMNNKIDLAQAEAIADLIDSASEQAARSAIRSLQGEFSQRIHALVDQLIQLRMYVESAIDFPEEEIDFLADHGIADRLISIMTMLQEGLLAAGQGCLMREGINVVIAGRPNAGKSSLLNRLARRDSAIVTDIPGTTRDVLREQIIIDGMPLHIIDTAGLHDSTHPVEQIGIGRAWDEIHRADRVLLVIDDSDKQSAGFLEQLAQQLSNRVYTVVRNKIDLTGKSAAIIDNEQGSEVWVSVKTGAGIDLLCQHLKDCAGFKAAGEGSFIARRRHLDALGRALEFLKCAQQQLNNHSGELMAEDLRQAQNALNEITGEFTSDDLLGKIFSSFCIGK